MCNRSSMIVEALIFAVLLSPVFGNSQNPQGQAKKLTGVLVFDLRPNTISPANVTVTDGWYLLRVRSGVNRSALQVILDRENASGLVNATKPRDTGGLEKLIHLQPGNHTLRVGTRTVWVATIVVQKQ